MSRELPFAGYQRITVHLLRAIRIASQDHVPQIVFHGLPMDDPWNSTIEALTPRNAVEKRWQGVCNGREPKHGRGTNRCSII
jgi:hypothetical protein